MDIQPFRFVLDFVYLNSFSGPSFWGLINPDWSLCNGGMSQSPINIKPQNVLFDPRLKDMIIGETKVSKARTLFPMRVKEDGHSKLIE